MGNQNTSGITEERAGNEAVRDVQEANPDNDETKGLHGRNGGPDSNDGVVEGDQSCPLEDLKEEANGFVNDEDSKALPDVIIPNGSINVVEMKESSLKEETSVFGNQTNDPSSSNLEDSNAKSTSTITNSNALPDGPVETEEDQEIGETGGSDNSCKIEAQIHTVKSIEKAVLNLDVGDVDMGKDGSAVDDTTPNEEALLEHIDKEEHSTMISSIDDAINCVSDERSIGLVDSSAAENVKEGECPTRDEQKPILNEVSGDRHECTVETDTLSDESNPKDKTDEIGMHVSMKIKLKDAYEARETVEEISGVQDNKTMGNDVIGHHAVMTPTSSEEKIDPEYEPPPNDEFVSNIISELTIPTLEPPQNNQLVSNIVSAPKIPSFQPPQDDQLVSKKVSVPELPNFEPTQNNQFVFNIVSVTEPLNVEPNPRDISVLRKSPSFDFGITPHNDRAEESDQTPLLYTDRAATRSFSSCSTLRFQSRSVQTEYTGKPLQLQAVEVEEKTIRMEQSNSQSVREVNRSSLQNDDKANIVVQATQESKCLKAGDLPKGNVKSKKARPSIFTTCICCTQAIS